MTWTNIAWRYLGTANLETLDRDDDWREILSNFGRNPQLLGKSQIPKPTTSPHLLELAATLDHALPNPDTNLSHFARKLRGAFALVVNSAGAVSTIEQHVFAIVPLDNPTRTRHLSLSIREAPGVVFLGRNCSEVTLAEALVHEADHQRVYELLEAVALVAQDSTCEFVSPWRSDLRPAIGLVLGASAFVQVGQFWRSLICPSSPNMVPADAGQRSVLAATQAIAALNAVLASDRLTDVGRLFCAALKGQAGDLLNGLQDHSSFADWQLKATECVTRHLQRCLSVTNPHGRCAEASSA